MSKFRTGPTRRTTDRDTIGRPDSSPAAPTDPIEHNVRRREPGAHRKPLTTRQLVAVASGVILVDQATKSATASLPCGPIVCPLGNTRLMLGVGVGSNVLTVLVGCGGVVVFAWWLRYVVPRRGAARAGAVIAGAGMIGNAADRTMLGGVRDFLAIPGGVVVNVADLAIVAGMSLCIAAISGSHRVAPIRPDSALPVVLDTSERR